MRTDTDTIFDREQCLNCLSQSLGPLQSFVRAPAVADTTWEFQFAKRFGNTEALGRTWRPASGVPSE